MEVLRGSEAHANAVPELLVEVPHGADERAHYDALRERLQGTLPADLHQFFHVNTDEGAWAYGRAAALALLAAAPQRSAVILRSQIPRTFVDCNRPADFAGSDLSHGGLTAGLHGYIRDPGDRALLLAMHRRYIEATSAAYRAVCGQGGLALVPHTYSPRSVGIDSVQDDIAARLRAAYLPETYPQWPLRAEVDLLTRDGDGRLFAPEGAEESLQEAFAEAGFEARCNDTYFLHPASLAHGWSTTYPGQVLCLELRRDLVVPDWQPFEESRADPERVARMGSLLAPTLERVLRR